MRERITPSAKTPDSFFQDERFSRFRRVRIMFGTFVLELPDADAVDEEARQRAADLHGEDRKTCLESYSRAAKELRAAVYALQAVERDDSKTFDNMWRAVRLYERAADTISKVSPASSGSIIDKKI
jgi:hypothetical protein